MSHAPAAAPRPLNLLAVSLRWPPYVAGGYELIAADACAQLRARGHRVSVLCARGPRLDGRPELYAWLQPALEDEHGERDLFAHSFAAGNAERFRLHMLSAHNLRATARALEASGAEAVLYFNQGLLSLSPLLAAQLRGLPRVCYAADAWPANHWVRAWREDPRQRDGKPERLAWLASYARGLRELVGTGPMLCASRFLARELAEAGLASADLELLPLPIASELFDAAPRGPVRARAPREPLRVLCLSMLWRGKGQHVLLSAAAEAVRRGAELELVLAGSGASEYRRELEALAAAPELVGRVRLTGLLDSAARRAELARAHVLAQPSLWGEPQGMAPLEGMAFGAAALISDAGGGPEQVQHGVDGWLARAGELGAWSDALCALAIDEPLRQRLAEAGAARVRARHDPREFAAALEARLVRALARGAA